MGFDYKYLYYHLQISLVFYIHQYAPLHIFFFFSKFQIIFFHRLHLWKKRTDGAKLNSKPPELAGLPPTSEALKLNIMRGHYQAMLWKASLERLMPDIDPCQV